VNGHLAPTGDLTAASQSKRPWELVVEDTVDTYYRKRDWKVPRSRNTQFCKHGANAMCDYCMPLEPYDAEYHSKNNIKHLSFHSYIRKVSLPILLLTKMTRLSWYTSDIEAHTSYHLWKPYGRPSNSSAIQHSHDPLRLAVSALAS